ncbi:MAG: 2-methylcitrate dehydratase PrpD [Gammaproteobacteria bacterium]
MTICRLRQYEVRARCCSTHWVGHTLAGVSEASALGCITIDYTRNLGGKAQSSVIGGGFRTPAPNAADANGTLCHALVYDNTGWPRNHPASPTIPAILAIAERDNCTGAQVLLAIVLAFEVQARLRLASQGMSSGGAFHHPGVSGTMGAVTGAGKLLDLSAAQFCMAFGNAGSRAGTLTANHGTMTKPSHSGLGARMGTEAALLAKSRLTAADDIFCSGEYLQTFYGAENCNPDLLLRHFGAPWRMVDPGVTFKRYPAKYSIHRAIEAAIDLACKHDLTSDNIDAVEIVYPPTKVLDRPQPCSGLNAKFSLQYGAAAGLLDRAVGIATFTDTRRFACDMQDLLKRINVRVDSAIPEDSPNASITVQVRTRDGAVLEQRCDRLKGMAGSPLSREERLAKFRDFAAGIPSAEATEKIISRVDHLAAARSSIRPLMSVLRRGNHRPV